MKYLAIASAILIAIGLTEYRQREFAKPLRLTPGSAANPYLLPDATGPYDLGSRSTPWLMTETCDPKFANQWGMAHGILFKCKDGAWVRVTPPKD